MNETPATVELAERLDVHRRNHPFFFDKHDNGQVPALCWFTENPSFLFYKRDLEIVPALC